MPHLEAAAQHLLTSKDSSGSSASRHAGSSCHGCKKISVAEAVQACEFSGNAVIRTSGKAVLYSVRIIH